MNFSKKEIENKIDNLYKQLQSISCKKPLYFRVSEQSPFVNPRLIKDSDFKDAIINKNGKPQLTIGTKDEFDFIDDVFNPFKIGDRLLFWFDGYFFNVVKKEEHEAYLAEKKKEQDINAQIRDLQEKHFLLEKEESEKSFWKKYSIPFKFTTSIKIVVSGLSESSWGDGSRKNSQMHLFFLEDYSNGRLSRKKGDYLCSQPKGKSTFEDLALVTASEKNKHIVTCPQCLKMMKRFKNEI